MINTTSNYIIIFTMYTKNYTAIEHNGTTAPDYR